MILRHSHISVTNNETYTVCITVRKLYLVMRHDAIGRFQHGPYWLRVVTINIRRKLYLLGLLLKPKFYQNDTILNRDIKLPIDSAFPQPCEFKC